ncbi:hypothetical protein BGZ46_000813 [Entomortierella lignicola]|nr:hypothetical protein BGZ46_000813 [Entomortierella lignicola]
MNKRITPSRPLVPNAQVSWSYDVSSSTWLPSQNHFSESVAPVPLEMASGFRDSTSPIAEAFEQESKSSSEEYIFQSRRRDKTTLEYISETSSYKLNRHRSNHSEPPDLPSTFTGMSLSCSDRSFKKHISQAPPLSSQPSLSSHHAQSEIRYFNRSGRGKRPTMSNVSRQIALMTGMTAKVHQVGSKPFTSSSSQNLDSKNPWLPSSPPPQTEIRDQPQQQVILDDLLIAHYSTSQDRILRPNPISYHHYAPQKPVRVTQLHCTPETTSKTFKSAKFNLSSSSQGDISESSSSFQDPSLSDSQCTTSHIRDKALSQPKNTFRARINHSNGAISEFDFPLPPTSKLPAIPSTDIEDKPNSIFHDLNSSSKSVTESPLLSQYITTSDSESVVGYATTLADDYMEILDHDQRFDESPLSSSTASYPFSRSMRFLNDQIQIEPRTPRGLQSMRTNALGYISRRNYSTTFLPMFPTEADNSASTSGPVFLDPNPRFDSESNTNDDTEAIIANEDIQAQSRSFAQRLREKFWLKLKKKKNGKNLEK